MHFKDLSETLKEEERGGVTTMTGLSQMILAWPSQLKANYVSFL